MMERNYPSSSFSDPLAPAAQTAAWAYERAGLKPSLSYGAGPTEADLLHRQAYTAAQLPSYSAAHHPAGLAGLFDTSIHGTGINTTETSVMNFLSAIESRTSSGATLLPQFRASSWQTGMHSSADLFVTGALPTSGTFPPTSALSAYQHPSSFSSRNFATTPTLTLQDGTFSAASNGLLSHDPILQLKASQCTIPTALTFDRLGSTVLTSSLPPQSSTYRSAQESAPHLLQPQFSLLPSALAGAQQASQAYSTAVFAGSTASIERALQRECSVIKHHQRPSSTQSVQAQLAGSHHSLQTYLSSASGITLQDTPRQSSLSCSPLADITQVSNGGLQQKASRVTVELAQSYTSSIPSSGYPLSSVKGKNCSTKPPPMSTKTSKPQSVVLPVQTQSYTKSAQSQSSVISSQAQIYSTAQLPSLLSVSQSQTYVSTQSPNLTTVSDSQSYSSLKSEDLLYKAINSFSGQSQAIPSASPTLRHSPGQQHSLPPVSNESYSDQARNLSSVTRSQSYTPSQSQSLSPVSHSPINYTSQSHILSASPSICYTSGQNLVPSSSLAYSSSPGVQNVSTASPTRNYISLPSSQSSQTQGSPSPQSQTFLPTVQSPFASPSRPQTLHNSRLSSEVKSYARKKKLQTDGYSPSKQEAEFPMQDLQTLQQHNTIEASNQRLGEGEIGDQESAYRVSKADDRYYSSGVIRSSSRLDDQELGLLLQRSKKDERMVSSVTQLSQQIAHSNSVASQEIKHSANLMQTSHDREHTKERTQQNEIINKANETKTEENTGSVTSNSAQIASHGLRLDQQLSLPNTHSLLESDCDLQILQQSMLQSNFEQTKISTPMPQIQRLQQTGHPFLQMDSHVHKNVGPSQQQIQPQNLEVMKMDIVELPKPMQHQERTTKDNFRLPNQHDTKSQFVSLSSMCFPESMLLTDEKNILSNVDDILAATAAACGVTTQEFAKAASSSGDIAVENSNSSKSHYRSDVGLVSQNFVTSQAAIVKNENVNTDSLNSSQMSLILQPASTVQPENQTFDKTPIDMSVQNMLSDIGSQVLRPDNEEQSATSATINRQSNTNQGIEEDNGVQNDVFSDPTGQNLASQDTSAHEETATSDNDHVDDRTVTANQTNLLLTETQTCRISGSVVDGVKRDITESNISSNRGITLPSADENANHKDNNDAQVKRTISKGIDISLPCSPADIAESYFDSFQHQERIRQKIKEVEEQQPEVKCGFIGSFLDFLKGEPKVAPPPKVPNRTKRSAAPILRAPILQHVPFKNLPLMNPVAPLDSDSTESQNMMEDGFKKKVETLPSFSSSDEDSGGGRDLQKSISTALSALEDTSDKKNKSESGKVTAAPVVKQETPCTSPPAIKVEEIPKAIETPKQPVFDGQLAKSQGSVAFEGSTEDEQSDSGGEGMFRERDEFVVKIEDMDALKLALNTGTEPPAIWKVQKALLQKFVPEVRDGQRQYSATNSYLGYFGDAKTKYKRVYAKFIENANKKEYVRVCSRKPRIKPQPVRPAHTKGMVNNKAQDSLAPKNVTTKVSTVKSKGKQPKIKAEPPPKKRKTWKEEFSSSHPDVTPEVHTGADPPPDQLMPVPEQHTTATEQSPPSQIDPSPALIQQQQPSSKQLIPAVSQPSPVPKQSPSASNQSLPATKELLPDQKQLPPSPKEPQLSTKQPPVPKRARPPPKRVRPPPKRARQAEVLQPLLTEKQDLLQPEKPEPLPSEKQELTPAEKEEHQQAEKLVPSTPVKADTLTTERLESSSSEKQLGLPLKQSPLTPNPTSTAPKEPQTTPEPLLSLFTARSLRTRAMKETFKSYMELLVSVALDAETMQALENSNDELLLPSMRKIDGMLNESQKKLLDKLNLVQSHKNALESFPELTVNLRENKSRKGPTSVSKIKVNGKTYNKKTLQNCKTSNRSSQEFTVKPERTHLCSLYHSLHHFKYHMYLTCKDEISTVLKGNADLGQEQIVQLCMKNMPWVEDLFEKFGELLSDVQEKCS
ncbi:glutamine and serine-rich protein 1 isoform X3 [Ambystoma mexicanum]|uniref:glutamine and serine-rich protein 1 isoform X3 n=1 Tax=Ambystoma mexicanum TaxID=8296 RepID=UPI0037E93612